MKKSLILSRYNEDVSWVKQWESIFDEIIVYNKGNSDLICDYTEIKLPNIGREAHTYLYHIINNYLCLSDITVFLQGSISDIVGDVFHDLNNYINMAQQFGYGASRIILCDESIYLNNCDFMNDPAYAHQIKTGALRLSDITMKDYYNKYFGEICNKNPVSFRGCFSVRKDVLLKYPHKFYVDLLNSIPQHSGPEEGHYLERLWAKMFLSRELY